MNQQIIFLIIFIFLNLSNLFSQQSKFDGIKSGVINNRFECPFNNLNNHAYLNRKTAIHKFTKSIKNTNYSTTFLIDSVVIIGVYGDYEKFSYRYNSYGDKILELLARRSVPEDDWSNERSFSYAYNSDRNLTMLLQQVWHENQLVNDIRHIYNYDSNGNISSELKEFWDSTQWTYMSRDSYFYDGYGDIITRKGENWLGDRWLNDWRLNYSYDSNRRLILNLGKRWNNVSWVNSSRITFTYNSNGDIAMEFRERVEDSNWVNYEKSTYTYNVTGNMVQWLREYWSWGRWAKYQRISYDYDSIGYRTLELGETWFENQWKNDHKYSYSYNPSGNIILELQESWAKTDWVNNVKFIYTYDTNENLILWYAQKGNGNASGGTLNFIDASGDNHSFIGSKIELFYNLFTNIEENEFSVSSFLLSQNYPNPFNPTTKIEYSIPTNSTPLLRGVGGVFVTLKVYDVLGKEVAILVNKEQSAGSYEVGFRANGLSSGVYFYRLRTGSFVETKKMLLLR